jgi:hypothetical protein
MLVGRIESVLDSVSAGGRTSPAQSGATGLTVDVPAPADAASALLDTPPPASAQAILSEVALTLDAISRFGGEATPAVIGEVPIWPSPPAIDTPSGSPSGSPSAPGAAAAEAAATAGAGASAAAQTESTGASSAVGAAATAMPVQALADALEQTVNGSGLFYESHLAQWLSGGYPAEALAGEPQTRLAAEAIQLPLDWDSPASGGAPSGTAGWPGSGASVPAGGGWLPHELPPQLSLPAFGPAAHPGLSSYPGASAEGAAWRGTQTTLLEDAAFGGSGGGHAANLPPDVRASIAASIHPATIPLVRQQLDVLATQQFRWTGEVWPGAKLDWTIEPERDRRAQAGEADETEQTWRTRVTLALPTLGTVDADLILTGTQLIVRVQASPGGAARLTAGGASFGQRLQAAGIELAGLQIREIGGTAAAAPGGGASAATSAYARAAAQAENEPRETAKGLTPESDMSDVSEVEVRDGGLDPAGSSGAQRGETEAAAKRGPVPSPIDRLFDDPFEWSGS